MHGALEGVAQERTDDAGERRGRRRPEAEVGALNTRPAAGDHLAGPGGVRRHASPRYLLGATAHVAPALREHEEALGRARQTADVSSHTYEGVVARHVPSREREATPDAGDLHAHAQVD